jgi:hypothetical protein
MKQFQPEEAKCAARGDSSPECLLPLLRHTKPVSKAATKQHFATEIKKQVSWYWKKSPQHNQMAIIDKSLPFRKFAGRDS